MAEQDPALTSSSSHLIVILVVWLSDYFYFMKVIVCVTFFSLFDDDFSVSCISIASVVMVMTDELGVM